MENESSESCCTDERGIAEDEVAGNDYALEALRERIVFPILYSREARQLDLKWPRGLLLYGPPGTGKTSLVRAVVQECGAHLTVISSQSVYRAHAGESEKVLRDAFAEASSQAASGKPSVIFIDEIDGLCPRRDSRRQQDVRVASQLLTLMDSNIPSLSSQPHVVVVASTNRVDALDPALRRAGRFDAEIEVGTPNEEDRLKVLKLYTRKVHLDPTVDLKAVASSCNGYVGADLQSLCYEAAVSATRRASDMSETEGTPILRMEDWEQAKSVVGPSVTRGVTVEVPNVTWDDIGGLEGVKKKLKQAVEWPIRHSDVFSRMGISPMRGILLHGPPGCSKTTLVKAAANAAQASFISLSGADLYSKYVGEGEALLRSTFQRARLAAPSIIFIDEVDAVAGKRGGSSTNNISVGERLLSTLLTEMDGLEEAKGILVLAATNRPYAIDPALMRPGRFDLILYVPPPDTDGRYEILKIHTRNNKLEDDVDLRKIAEDTELFTGSELMNLCREAAIVALAENIATATTVCDRHFQMAKSSLKPALTAEEVAVYSSFMKSKAPKSSPRHDLGMKNANGQRRHALSLMFSAKVGVLTFILLAAGKYLACSNQSQLEVAAT